MALESLLKRLPSMPRLLRPAHPSVAVEITERAVTAARGSSSGLSSWWSAPLPEGAVRSAAVQQNLVDRDAVLEQLRRVSERLAPEGAPVALALPDAVMRLAVLSVDAVPRRREEVRDLVSWRLKKTLPYRVDEAALSWEVYSSGPEDRKLILAAALRRRVLEEYEDLLAEVGLEVGSVTASSLTLCEVAPVEPERDALFLNVGRGWFSMLVTDGRLPLFYRNKPIPEGERAPGLREAFVASELFPTLEYYKTRLDGRGLGRLVLHAAGGGAAELEEALVSAAPQADGLFPARTVAAPVPESVPAELQARLAAVATLAMRSWRREPETSVAALGGAA